MNASDEPWHRAPKGDVHEQVFAHVRAIEQDQSDIYDRLAYLESLYDPYSPTGDDSASPEQRLANVSENVVASNVDTVYASVATAEIRARFLTDGASYKAQRRAKRLEYYVEGLGKQLNAHKKCRLAFKEASKKGGGAVKVYADRWDRPVIEHVRLEDLYVPNEDSRSGDPPLQMHHVQRNYDYERLRAEYPEAAEEIDTAVSSRTSTSLQGYERFSLLARRKLTVIESTRLPIGEKPPKGKTRSAKGARYVPGRRTITIAGRTLLDEPYHKQYHPYAIVTWSDRQGSFYGISGAERIAGIQRALNKRNWQIDRVLDQNALLTTYVRPADGGLVVKTTKVGNVAVIKGDYPQTPNPPLVASETYQSRAQLKQAAFEEFGVSQLAAQSKIPAGLETGAAVREYRDQATERWSPQEADFEALVLDVYFLLVDACKELGAAAPMVLETRWQRPIAWSEVDMGDVRIQLAAASTLPRSAAGREQTILEWAQAGVISTDTFRRLSEHPDLESELSLYTSAIDVIDLQLETILDGGDSTPEPYDYLELAQWRAGNVYNKTRTYPKVPESVLEGLRDYMSLTAYLISQKAAADPAMAGAGALQGPPTGQPDAALSSQAMQLRPTAAP